MYETCLIIVIAMYVHIQLSHNRSLMGNIWDNNGKVFQRRVVGELEAVEEDDEDLDENEEEKR